MTKPLFAPTEAFEAGSPPPPRRPRWRMLKVQYRRWSSRWRRSRPNLSPSYWVVGGVALTAALATIQNPIPVQLIERNAQTLFFDLRGSVPPPGNNPELPQQPEIVILAMDGDTMTQGTQIYPSDPTQYAYFAPIQQWPWQRTAYAIVIERLMQAGARAVVLDVVLDANSSYGEADDARLQQVLKRYPGRVTLAAKYVEEEKRTGFETQLLTPNPLFQAANPILGFINLPISANGRMHELGRVYWQETQAQYAELGIELPQIPSLAEGALQAAQVDYPVPLGKDLFFYGPSQTFRHIPFWHVLDPQNWQGYHLKNQTFKDKLVLIGPTGGGESFQDFHLAPFSGTLRYPEKLAGVEIQANAIATLMQGRTLMPLFTHGLGQGVFVVGVVVLAGYVQNRQTKRLRLSQLLHRFGYGVAIALGYGVISYVVFVQGRLILPTAVPMLAISMGRLAALAIEIVGYQRRLRRDMKKLPDTSTDLETDSSYETAEAQEVLERRKQEFLGSILKGRYQVESEIGKGGFGETYLAKDLQRPGTPFCVVKRLRPQNKSDKVMRLAEKLFKQEAEVLQQLGHHDQIPDLLAFFNQDNDFYLVQQYVHGKSLADELTLSTASRKVTRPLNEQAVVLLLSELLHILDFVHHHKVIHRDIKPANILRRQADRKLVLIDFGAVKQVRDLDVLDDGTQLTVPIGTSGYMAPEQAQGRPYPASDIYSLGMTGIRALTGIEPRNLDTNQQGETQGLDWRDTLRASEVLIQILEKMTCFNLSDRYQTAQAVLVDLQPLVKSSAAPVPPAILPPGHDDCSVTDVTQPWQFDSPDLPLPPTDPELSPPAALEQGKTEIWQSEAVTDPTTPATDEIAELLPTDAETPAMDAIAEFPPTDAEPS